MRIEVRWFIDGQNGQTAEEVLEDERMEPFIEELSQGGSYVLEPRTLSHKMPEGIPSYVSLGCDLENWSKHASFFMRALIPQLEGLGIKRLELWVDNQPFWNWVATLERGYLDLLMESNGVVSVLRGACWFFSARRAREIGEDLFKRILAVRKKVKSSRH